MPNVLVVLTFPAEIRRRYADAAQAVSPDLHVTAVDHHSRVAPHIAETDILVTFGPMMEDAVFASAPRLKWVQALGSGVDGITDQPSLRRGTLVTNMRGIHGEPVAEAAIGSMLALVRDVPANLRRQAQHRWERRPVRILAGKTAVIIGIGVIAEALAPRLKALGMTVLGVSSAPRGVPGFDRIEPRDRLRQTVAEADHLILLMPHTPQTHDMIDTETLAAMKPGAYVVNLARGGVLNEPALIAALTTGRLAGAALDVFATEPLPPDNPLWDLENVIVTPHLGGFFDEYPDLAIPVVQENLRRYLAGDIAHMVNVVEW